VLADDPLVEVETARGPTRIGSGDAVNEQVSTSIDGITPVFRRVADALASSWTTINPALTMEAAELARERSVARAGNM
jgi:hypothetical protein